jgi:hypothetical protein
MLDRPGAGRSGDEDVARFHVAMHKTPGVRGVEGSGDAVDHWIRALGTRSTWFGGSSSRRWKVTSSRSSSGARRRLAATSDHPGVPWRVRVRSRAEGRSTPTLYDDINLLAPHWPRDVPHDDARGPGAKRSKHSGRRASQSIGAGRRIGPETLSRWRHGFKSRWDSGGARNCSKGVAAALTGAARKREIASPLPSIRPARPEA